MTKKFSRFLVVFLLLGGVLSGCSDSTSPMAPDTPALDTEVPQAISLEALVLPEPEEEIYLIETFDLDPTENGSILYSVELIGGVAQLTMLLDLTTGAHATDFDRAHIGATPDGEYVYLVNREGSYAVGTYEVDSGTFTKVGNITGLPTNDGTVLVAFAPDGTLYIAGQESDHLFTIDLGTFAATDLGPIGFNLAGADMAFTQEGDFYVWTNHPVDLGLYLVEVNGAITPTKIGGTNSFLTGLALRDGGAGDLLGSDKENDTVEQIDKTTGNAVASFPMMVDLGAGWVAYDHIFGDMTVGTLIVELEGCTYTHGWWKHRTRIWPDGYARDNPFFGSGMTWLEILTAPSKGGDEYIILGRQWAAAALNVANGASMAPDALAAFNAAEAYLAGSTTPSRDDVIGWSETLTDYNEGKLGVPHCDAL